MNAENEHKIECDLVENGSRTINGTKKSTQDECNSCENSETGTSSEVTDEMRREKLSRWMNKQMRIEIVDGRILIGTFSCTDKDANIILSCCNEMYDEEKTGICEEPRMLGLVMVPGKCVTSISIDTFTPSNETNSSVFNKY